MCHYVLAVTFPFQQSRMKVLQIVYLHSQEHFEQKSIVII